MKRPDKKSERHPRGESAAESLKSFDPDNLIPRRQAGVILGICPRTVYRHERENELKPYRRNSRSTLYRLGDVLALKESWARTPQAAPPCAPDATTKAKFNKEQRQ